MCRCKKCNFSELVDESQRHHEGPIGSVDDIILLSDSPPPSPEQERDESPYRPVISALEANNLKRIILPVGRRQILPIVRRKHGDTMPECACRPSQFLNISGNTA